MEFWGVEVKPGETILVKVEKFHAFYLTQAVLEKTSEGSEGPGRELQLKAVENGKHMDLVTLHDEDLLQKTFFQVFIKDFSLSHNSNNCNVYVFGHRTMDVDDHDDDDDDDDDDDEEQGSDKENKRADESASKKAKTEEPC